MFGVPWLYGPKAGGTWPAAVVLKGADGANGTNGTNGTNGQGVPTGGSTGQWLRKNSATDYATSWAGARPAVFTRSATANATASTDTTMNVDATPQLAGDVNFGLGAYVPQVAGTWKITVQGEWAANANGFRQIDLYFNNTTSYIVFKENNNGNASNVTTIVGSYSLTFNGTTDFVVIRSRHNSTTTPLACRTPQVTWEWLG